MREAEAPVETVTLSQTTLTLKPGETAALTATVRAGRAPTRLWYGTAPTRRRPVWSGARWWLSVPEPTEIAAIAGGVKAACGVTVAEDGLKAASLMLSAGTLELTEGRTAALTATVLPPASPEQHRMDQLQRRGCRGGRAAW